ncbi:hypothetical protein Btru_010696 [Bulinus truncatus]|nr:hypothetical protein Btru_010696 [Bulinus truncatus]
MELRFRTDSPTYYAATRAKRANVKTGDSCARLTNVPGLSVLILYTGPANAAPHVLNLQFSELLQYGDHQSIINRSAVDRLS